jgi:aldehyde:ferredoxin oxidoreductase
MPNSIKGFTGRFLRVDLSEEKLTELFFDESTLRRFLGGTGIGSKILYDEVPPNSEWSDPVNRVIIASGPLGGTIVGGSGTISIVTKGALTDGATSVQANGLFGAYMKFSGYDGIILQGAAEEWKYLLLKDGSAELRDAKGLLGLDTYEVCDVLRREHGVEGRNASILSIGPAGENLVRFAGAFVDHGHSASHNGPGAVIGSKKLKAIIAFRGQGGIEVADTERLRKVSQRMYEDVEWFKGTIGLVESMHRSGDAALPIMNYTTNIWDISNESIGTFSKKQMREHYQIRRVPCWACRLLHCTWMEIPEGPYKGQLEEPEYEQMAAWAPVIDQDDVEAAMMLSALTDRLGFENNEAGWLVSWVMECYEKGFITDEDTGGLAVRWGDVEAVKEILHMVSERKGFGDLLAEGVKRASETIGGEAAKAAIYTMKGNTPRGHDHRARWAELFDTCVSNTGTIETHMSVMGPDVQGAENPIAVSTAVAKTKGLMEFEDSVGTCRFNTRMNAELICEAISASTGWDFTTGEGIKVGLRAVNLMRAFNLRVGIGKEHDYPSVRYGSTPVDGTASGISILPHWEAMLRNYYKLMGWNAESGVPLPETLRDLEISYVTKDL